MAFTSQSPCTGSLTTASHRLQSLRLRGEATLREMGEHKALGFRDSNAKKQSRHEAGRKSFTRSTTTASKRCETSNVMYFSSPQEALKKLAELVPSDDNQVHSI
eukprot:TRINITY_DN28570_c1_g2_i2.p3 TRINITY_DN28570_c1_g2~~TRINITY_DN28570_c1_g2_i2.p3  ORF type:complete len:104 (+),score=12.40 TRINITY_DN28570_c1_g2_i2:90-401(+)